MSKNYGVIWTQKGTRLFQYIWQEILSADKKSEGRIRNPIKARGSLSCRGGEGHFLVQVERAMSTRRTNMAKENETRHILHRANKHGNGLIII
jgi:hypothetical protein